MHPPPPTPAGSDPTKLIEDLAKRKKIKTLGVSMGQGQEVIARKLMATATAEGQWLLLQNTHLGLNYLTEVEQYLSKAEDLHEDFRCVSNSGIPLEG
jgi:dynein heavy chain